ncbi:hypothetical protein [Sinorhizobium meliloti]|uniref:hypothetical protein n=1 Tax=Rhizobium meliloti TaxID=382 RepID=UPI000FDB6A70|nr:hypothetical protein [Sinorhizobium meliloti]MDW9928063.1 hypothetical protein [Sinorhizobium meliloti]MDX0964794.1 hypothetical protein [Sinorhizobium medicae]RVI54943.1 hypothetical protein CN195_04820 [Sinorhizobium meliloti]
MRSLTDFLKDLPGVAPRKAYALVKIGDLLAAELKRDLHPRSDSLFDLVTVVGPDAAAAILHAYKEGSLPMQRRRSVEEAPIAEAYVRDAEPLRELIDERKRRKCCLKDVSLVRESDFLDHRLMNRIFFEKLGAGPGKLTLAGIEVSKDIRGFSSNSGKTTGYDSTFTWTGSDGVPRNSGSGPPSEAFNRRNDEKRNWGLHE